MCIQIFFPKDKLTELRPKLNSRQLTRQKDSLHVHDLQCILGLLNFACQVLAPGRAFKSSHKKGLGRLSTKQELLKGLD